MQHLKSRGWVTRFSRPHRGIRTNNVIVALCSIAIAATILVSCGSAAIGQTRQAIPTSTATLAPIPTSSPTIVPTAKPTLVPTPKPTVAPQPTSPPSAPAILDVRPSSMSIVGHLDCQKNGAYICLAEVLSRSSNQSNLNWFAYTNVPGHIVFSPSRGVLAPGQSVLVTITVPFTACTQGLFFFQGPINTHTITWAC